MKECVECCGGKRNNVAVQLINSIENLSFEYLRHSLGSDCSLFLKEQLDIFNQLLKMELEK